MVSICCLAHKNSTSRAVLECLSIICLEYLWQINLLWGRKSINKDFWDVIFLFHFEKNCIIKPHKICIFIYHFKLSIIRCLSYPNLTNTAVLECYSVLFLWYLCQKYMLKGGSFFKDCDDVSFFLFCIKLNNKTYKIGKKY